jgi:hypothetical protein
MFSALIFICNVFCDFVADFLVLIFCICTYILYWQIFTEGEGTVGLCEIEHRDLASKYRDCC